MVLVPRSIWILGYGQFGKRTTDLLAESGKADLHLTVIDSKPPGHVADGIHYIQSEGVRWFVDNFHRASTVDWIIPALPVHLAAEWIKARLIAENRTVRHFPVPEKILPFLPNPYRISTDTYALSHATFLCPPDCEEPEEFCTVTGLPRSTPIYRLVLGLSLENVVILSIRSRQFAPGAGGFYADDLWMLLETVRQHGPADFLLCTGCRCHGIITGLRVMD